MFRSIVSNSRAADRARSLTERAGYPWMVLGAISVAMVMSVLDSTIVNVAIAKLQAAFGESTDAVQWVVTGYLLSFAVILAASGWLADRFGFKAVFLVAVAVFTTASFLCSVSFSLGSLIFFRILQGIGGGMMGPVSMAIIMREFPKEKLGTAIAVYMIPTLASSAFGPTVGGWLIDNFSWQMIFDVNVPIGIAGFIFSSIILRPYPPKGREPFDFLGFASAAVALGALLLALADGNADWNTDGWSSTFVLSCFGISAVGFATFILCELTTDHRLVDFSPFRSFNFSLTMVLIFVFGLGVFGSSFLLPLYLQAALGYTPMQAGMVFIPNGLVMIAAGVIGGRLMDRIGPKIPGVAGIIVMAYGMYRFSFLSPQTSNGAILATQCLLGGGMGLLMSPLQTTAISGIAPERAAQASGLIQILRQLGGSFGIAILSTILIHREHLHAALLGEAIDGNSPALKAVLLQVSYFALSATGGTPGEAVSKAQAIFLSHAQTQVFASSIDDLYFLTMIVSLLSAVPFLFVRTSRRNGKQGMAPAIALE